MSSLARMKFWIQSQHYTNKVWWHSALLLCNSRIWEVEERKDQEFKVILSYRVSSRPVWVTWERDKGRVGRKGVDKRKITCPCVSSRHTFWQHLPFTAYDTHWHSFSIRFKMLLQTFTLSQPPQGVEMPTPGSRFRRDSCPPLTPVWRPPLGWPVNSQGDPETSSARCPAQQLYISIVSFLG